MVRRLLLTALLAALAVALPAAAEADPAFGPPTGSDPSGCLPSNLFCGLDLCSGALDPCALDDPSASFSLYQAVGGAVDEPTCRAWDVNMPDAEQSIWETVTVDPEGCIRRYVWETLEDLPPVPQVLDPTSSFFEENLPWP